MQYLLKAAQISALENESIQFPVVEGNGHRDIVFWPPLLPRLLPMQYLETTWKKCHYIWHKHPLWLRDEPAVIWRSVIEVTLTAKQVFVLT